MIGTKNIRLEKRRGKRATSLESRTLEHENLEHRTLSRSIK